MVDRFTPSTRAALSLTGHGSRAFYLVLALLTFSLPLLTLHAAPGTSAPEAQSGMGALPPPSLEPNTRLGFFGAERRPDGWPLPRATSFALGFALPLRWTRAHVRVAPDTRTLVRWRQLRLEGG